MTLKNLFLPTTLIAITLLTGACHDTEPTQPTGSTSQQLDSTSFAPDSVHFNGIGPAARAFPGADLYIDATGLGTDTSALKLTLNGMVIPVERSYGNFAGTTIPQDAHSGEIILYKNGRRVKSDRAIPFVILSIRDTSYTKVAFSIHDISAEEEETSARGEHTFGPLSFGDAATFRTTAPCRVDADDLRLTYTNSTSSGTSQEVVSMTVDPTRRIFTSIRTTTLETAPMSGAQRMIELRNVPFTYKADGTVTVVMNNTELEAALSDKLAEWSLTTPDGTQRIKLTRIFGFPPAAGARITISPM